MSKKNNREFDENIIACIIKAIAVFFLVFNLIFALFNNDNVFSNENIINIAYILMCSLGIYASGELLQILHDIRSELRNK